jgi:hypothetical protein
MLVFCLFLSQKLEKRNKRGAGDRDGNEGSLHKVAHHLDKKTLDLFQRPAELTMASFYINSHRRLDEAIVLINTALQLQTRTMGEFHWCVRDTLLLLAKAKAAMGEVDEALRIALRILVMEERDDPLGKF